MNALGGCGFDWPQNWYDQFVTVDPNDPDTVFMDTFEVWKSTDGGASFSDITCSYSGGTVHPDEHALALAPGATNVMLAGGDGGVYLTTDGGNRWTDLNGVLEHSGDIRGRYHGQLRHCPAARRRRWHAGQRVDGEHVDGAHPTRLRGGGSSAETVTGRG